MNDLVAIKVYCHSGYRSDEYPMYFEWDDMGFDIKENLDRWQQGDMNPEFVAADYFKVMTTDNKIFILRHEIDSDKWFLWLKGESMNL